LITQINKS